jgi:hypothetical protein
VRVIEIGMDVDGDGRRDLNPSRIYFFSQSMGGGIGTAFLSTEPNVRVAGHVPEQYGCRAVLQGRPLSRSYFM